MLPRFLFICLCIITSLSSTSQTLETRIGQMLLVGLPDNKMDSTSPFYQDLKAGRIGGFVVYERTLTPANSAENLKALIDFYQSAAPTTLFIAITQEGGLVNRLKTKYGFPPMPSAQYLGALNKLDSTKWYADNTAFTLSRLGINLNFAPVVDVYSATNPVLGSRERTFSKNADTIVKHAKQVIASHKYFGVATALKHFPGHGSSTKDSHLELTDVSTTWSDYELKPYKILLKKKMVDAIMTAHIVNKQLDESRLPATLSKKMIDGLLRKKLKFKGVVFSDDMQMKAIAAEYSMKEAVTLAINAGVDVLLFSGFNEEIKSADDMVKMIVKLVEEKKISENRINEAYGRIMKMKSGIGNRESGMVNGEW
jgi:beta-N-acetylhexosaminidase